MNRKCGESVTIDDKGTFTVVEGGVIGTNVFGNFVSLKGMVRKLMQAIILDSRNIYFRLSVFMVTNQVTPLWPIKTSKLPKVSPLKVCNLKM